MRKLRLPRQVRAFLGGAVVVGSVAIGGPVTVGGAAAIGAVACVLKEGRQVHAHTQRAATPTAAALALCNILHWSLLKVSSLQKRSKPADQQQSESESQLLHSAEVSFTSSPCHRRQL